MIHKVIQNDSKSDSKRFKTIQNDSDVIFSQWFKHFSNMIVFLWKKFKRVFSRGLNLKRVSVLFSFRRFSYPKLSSTASPDFYAIIKWYMVIRSMNDFSNMPIFSASWVKASEWIQKPKNSTTLQHTQRKAVF